MRTLIPILIALLPISCLAEQFPNIPGSDRILTAGEVENYWFNTLRQRPIPRKPSSLHPAKQATWEAELRARRQHLQSVLAGVHRDQASLAALEHNIEAYRRMGDATKLAATQSELWARQEHHAKLAALRTQRETATRIAEAAERAADAAEAAASAASNPVCPQPLQVTPTGHDSCRKPSDPLCPTFSP
jgi:hypothetical protein